MLEQVENLLKAIKAINQADISIDQYRTDFKPNNSWNDVVRPELLAHTFSQIEKNELRHVIETLEHIERIINPDEPK